MLTGLAGVFGFLIGMANVEAHGWLFGSIWFAVPAGFFAVGIVLLKPLSWLSLHAFEFEVRGGVEIFYIVLWPMALVICLGGYCFKSLFDSLL